MSSDKAPRDQKEAVDGTHVDCQFKDRCFAGIMKDCDLNTENNKLDTAEVRCGPTLFLNFIKLFSH